MTTTKLYTILFLSASVLSTSDAAPMRAQAQPGAGMIEPAGGIEGFAYFAAIDTILIAREPLWRKHPDTLQVLNSIYWRPWVERGRLLGASLGPLPFGITGAAYASRIFIRRIDPARLTAAKSDREPIVLLGPIDFLDGDDAFVRLTLFTPPVTNEAWLIRVRRTSDEWRATWLSAEGSN